MNFVSTSELYKDGYGIIAKKAMRDKNLSIEAKAIYSYICSFAGAGATSFPGVALMLKELGISEKRFYNHRKQLIDTGYLTIVKQRKNNRADKNLYTIESEPSKVEKIQKEKEFKEKSDSKAKEKKSEELVDNIQVILKLCQITNFKLKEKEIKVLITAYDLDKIYKAIATASSTKTFLDGKIKNFYGYLTKVLNENDKPKADIKIIKKEKKSKFKGYEQREYDYDQLEKDILGFD